MKYLLSLLTLLTLLACSSSGNDAESDLRIVSSSVIFSAAPQSGTITVSSTGAITASSSQPWCTTSVNDRVVTVTVEGMTRCESRSALVTITDGISKVEVPVYQSGNLFLLDPSQQMSVTSEKQSLFVSANISFDYDLTFSADWVHAEKVSDGFNLIFDENNGDQRSVEVGIHTQMNDTTLVFTQESLRLSKVFMNNDWYVKYSTLGTLARIYWDQAYPLLSAKGEDMDYAYIGNGTGGFGFFFSCGGNRGSLLINCEAIGENQVSMVFSYDGDENGVLYYNSYGMYEALFPFCISSTGTDDQISPRTFTITMDNKYDPTYVLLREKGLSTNVIRLWREKVERPFEQ